ncbi:hypothetical protein [Acrocarpospora catenulata]|uniref:hypothetical protein n=1 Tax=Acrocarpospora catenulata TaxID=2836182 RepID=UPI001BD966B1|nr:hypothetical protein [Acrocarpospora catenulata]
MSLKRQDEALKDLAEAIENVRIPDAPTIRQAFVEPYVDAEGEAALKALIIVDAPDGRLYSRAAKAGEQACCRTSPR